MCVCIYIWCIFFLFFFLHFLKCRIVFNSSSMTSCSTTRWTHILILLVKIYQPLFYKCKRKHSLKLKCTWYISYIPMWNYICFFIVLVKTYLYCMIFVCFDEYVQYPSKWFKENIIFYIEGTRLSDKMYLVVYKVCIIHTCISTVLLFKMHYMLLVCL